MESVYSPDLVQVWSSNLIPDADPLRYVFADSSG